MGQRYALLLAAVTALVDALPVFGTGTVLLPWAAVCLLAGQAPPGGGSGGPVCGDLRRAQPSGAQGHGRPGGTASPWRLWRPCTPGSGLGVAGMILLPMALLFVKQLHDEGYVGLWK